jgi:hypothetical protein
MKKLLLTALLALGTSGLTAGPSFAWTFGLIPHHGCCGGRHCCGGCNFCVRPYNAFSPVACGNICLDGCSPFGTGGGCGAGGCAPFLNYGGIPCAGPYSPGALSQLPDAAPAAPSPGAVATPGPSGPSTQAGPQQMSPSYGVQSVGYYPGYYGYNYAGYNYGYPSPTSAGMYPSYWYGDASGR